MNRLQSFVGWGAALLLALAYLLNLGSLYAPTNGDEMVYLHIAHQTAESGQWLPLVSDLQTPSGGEMRNTKPPLLFWQAMLAGSFSWDLFVLRLPYVLQTLLCAGLVAWLVRAVRRRAGVLSISRTLAQQSGLAHRDGTSEREWREVLTTPLLAAALYLGFFATYRYGRPALPSSTESLFLFGVCALAIARKPHPAWLAAGAGLMMIPALLSKSFVLAAPVGLWLFAALWLSHPLQKLLQRSWQSAWPSALAVAIGLAGFALWFALDPHPAAVWREFVIGENFSTKFSNQTSRTDGLASFWLSPFINAGLFAPLLVGLCIAALQTMRDKALRMTHPEKLLWLWVLCWMLVFTLPSQRSARYVIPIMPALAVLLALHAPRIHRAWWMLTLALIGLATAALAWIAWCLEGYSPVYYLMLALVLVAVAAGLFKTAWREGLTAGCAIAWLALLGALAAPFDGAAGRFDAAAVQQVAGHVVQVPQNFNAQFEQYRFVLPASQPIPYAASQGLPPAQHAPEALWAVVAGDTSSCVGCTVMASRLVLRSRHNPSEVTLTKLSSREGVQKLLVEREYLLKR